MFNTLDTTSTWLTSVSKRKLSSSSPGAHGPDRTDSLLRRVLLRNSISRVDLALVNPPSSLPTPQQSDSAPDSNAGDAFVFPDATSLGASRVYSPADNEAEAQWLDSLLKDLSDDEDEEDTSGNLEDEDEEEVDAEEDDYLDAESIAWLLSTDTLQPISVPSPTSVPVTPTTTDDLPYPYLPPEDSEDDLVSLSTLPGMEEDIESEPDSESVEWPPLRSLSRSLSSSSLSQLVASADDTPGVQVSLPSIPEGVVYAHVSPNGDDEVVRTRIHVEEPQLWRPNERPLVFSPSTTGSSC